MHQVPSDPRLVVILADFDAISPGLIFDHFTTPELLVKWWPSEAETDPRVGGGFRLSWPERNWLLTGEYKSFVRSVHLEFSWRWDHEPGGEKERRVNVWLEPYLTTGAKVGIYHGDFSLDEIGREDRQGVAEGWIHFLMRLGGLYQGNAGE